MTRLKSFFRLSVSISDLLAKTFFTSKTIIGQHFGWSRDHISDSNSDPLAKTFSVSISVGAVTIFRTDIIFFNYFTYFA